MSLIKYSNQALLAELVRRGGYAPAPTKTVNDGSFVETLVGVNAGETARIVLPKESLETLCLD